MPQAKIALCLIYLAPIILLVACIAYTFRSRCFFGLGVVGTLVGFLVPQTTIYTDYSSAEAAAMAGLRDSARHVLNYGAVGSVVGSILGWVVGHIASALARRRMRDKQTSMPNCHDQLLTPICTGSTVFSGVICGLCVATPVVFVEGVLLGGFVNYHYAFSALALVVGCILGSVYRARLNRKRRR